MFDESTPTVSEVNSVHDSPKSKPKELVAPSIPGVDFYELPNSDLKKRVESIGVKTTADEVRTRSAEVNASFEVASTYGPDPAIQNFRDFDENLVNDQNHDLKLASFVDLHQVPPGTEIQFAGGHNSAFYYIRTLGGGKMEFWRPVQEGTVPMIGDVDGLWSFVEELEDGQESQDPNPEGFLLKGALVINQDPNQFSSFIAPYFARDKAGKTQKTTLNWGDTTRGIFVRVPKS